MWYSNVQWTDRIQSQRPTRDTNEYEKNSRIFFFSFLWPGTANEDKKRERAKKSILDEIDEIWPEPIDPLIEQQVGYAGTYRSL